MQITEIIVGEYSSKKQKQFKKSGKSGSYSREDCPLKKDDLVQFKGRPEFIYCVLSINYKKQTCNLARIARKTYTMRNINFNELIGIC